MRKDLLKKLVAQHKGPCAFLLQEFIQSKKSLAAEDEDIPYNEFRDYLEENHLSFNLQQEDKSGGPKSDSDGSGLFSHFLKSTKKSLNDKKTKPRNETRKLNSTSSLSKLPGSILEIILAPFLNAQDVAILSASCYAFYIQTKSAHYWKDKLLAIGCGPHVLDEVLLANVIQNYKRLYRVLSKFHYTYRARMKWGLWELFCLSGDPRAIDYAIKKNIITAETRSTDRQSALHLTAASGSLAAIEQVLAIKGMDRFCKTKEDETVLHWAALSDCPDAIDWPCWQGIDPLARTKVSSTLLYFSAQAGPVATFERALAVPGMDPLAKNKDGSTIVHWAVFNRSPRMIDRVLEIKKVNLLARANDGRTVLHSAVKGGSLSVIRHIRAMPEMRLLAIATTNEGATILHAAAVSGSVEVIEEVLAFPGHDPLAKNNNDYTALHYAAYHGPPKVINRIAAIEGMDLLAKTNDGLNVLHLAAGSGLQSNVIQLRVLVFQKLGFDFDPCTQTNGGHDAFWYADQSGNAAAVRAALVAPIETLVAQKKLEDKKITSFKKIPGEKTKKEQADGALLQSNEFKIMTADASYEVKKTPGGRPAAFVFNTKKIQHSPAQKKQSLSKIAPDEIVPNLLLGNLACDENYLHRVLAKKKGAAKNLAILRCTNAPLPTNISPEQIQRLAPEQFKLLNITDTPDEKINEHFGPCFDFIEQALMQGKTVVVYCGSSMSPTIVAAYLMRKHGLSTEHAINHVTNIRPIVNINENFKKRLRHYGQKLTEKEIKQPQDGPTTISSGPKTNKQLTQTMSLLSCLLNQAIVSHPYYRSVSATLCIIGGLAIILTSVFVAIGSLGIATVPAILGLAGGGSLLCGGIGLFYHKHTMLNLANTVSNTSISPSYNT